MRVNNQYQRGTKMKVLKPYETYNAGHEIQDIQELKDHMHRVRENMEAQEKHLTKILMVLGGVYGVLILSIISYLVR